MDSMGSFSNKWTLGNKTRLHAIRCQMTSVDALMCSTSLQYAIWCAIWPLCGIMLARGLREAYKGLMRLFEILEL